MWIGIVVLATFGGASVACLYLSLRAARQGKWHVFAALLLPALVIGGTIVMLIWRPVWLELFGDSNLEPLPASAVLLTGDDLIAVYSATARFGLRYMEKEGSFRWYDETHSEKGGFKGQDDMGATWSGGWEEVEERICYTLGQDTVCYDVYRDGERYYEANHRDEIVNRYRLMPPPTTAPEGVEALSAAALALVVPGHTLSGELRLHDGDPFYSARFAADGDGVAVRRGAGPGELDGEEAGSYRLDGEGALCLAGVLHLVDECFTLVPSSNGFDLVRARGRVLATVTRLE